MLRPFIVKVSVLGYLPLQLLVISIFSSTYLLCIGLLTTYLSSRMSVSILIIIIYVGIYIYIYIYIYICLYAYMPTDYLVIYNSN